MPTFRLDVRDPLGERAIEITQSPFRIGRRETNDLRLNGTEVSRDHAEIEITGERVLLRDRGSRYGTFVNGELVTEREIHPGDEIRLGRGGGADLTLSTGAPVSTSRSGSNPIGDVRQVAALLDGLRALGSGRVLQDVLALVIDSAIDISGAERGFIMLAAAASRRCPAPPSPPAARFPRKSSARANCASSPTCSTAVRPTCTSARWRSGFVMCCARR